MLTALKLQTADPITPSVIATPSGARAEVEDDTVRVRAADGAVLFEYDAESGRGTLRMPTALRLETPGDIELVAGKKLHLQATEAETQFESLIERVGNAYRYVKELHQLKAGRVRSLVRGAIQLKSQRVSMLAREDVHIDGQRINLG